MKTRSLLAIAVTALALAAPHAASAADLYAQAGAGVTQCTQDDPCSLQSAVGLADIVSNRDTIHIVGPFASDHWVDLTHSPIDLIGSGRGANGTTFSGDDAQIQIGADSSASGFALNTDACTVRITAGGTLRDASLDSPSCGIDVDASSAHASLIDNVDVNGIETGIAVHGGASGQQTTIRDSHVRARVGIAVDTPGAFSLERSTVESETTAVRVAHATTSISNSVVRVLASGGNGVEATQAGIVTVFMSTIDGTGLGAYGLRTPGGGWINVRGSIVRGFVHDLSAEDAFSVVFASYSDAATSYGGRLVDHGGNTNVDPRWRNAAAGDYRLAHDSPLIDKGPDDVTVSGETDRAGKSRVEDGDNDGTAVRDIGAYEYQPSEPEPAPPGSGDDHMTGGDQPQGPAGGDEQPPASGGDQQQPQQPAPVQPTPLAAPLKLTLSGSKLKLDKRGRGSVSVSCSAKPCTVRLVITAGKHTLATASGRAGKLKVRLPLSYLKKHRVRRVKISATVTDALGRHASAANTFSVL